jgi:hypothetical protein
MADRLTTGRRAALIGNAEQLQEPEGNETMWIKRLAITLIAMNLLAHPALGDILMLRDGVKFAGSVVDREKVRTSPTSCEWIWFVPDGSEEQMRFPVSDVEYILLQDGAEEHLVEFTNEPTPYEAGSTTMMAGSVDSNGNVAWIIAAGLAIAGIGVLIKLGGESEMERSGVLGSSYERYGAANYALVGIGSAIAAGGLARAISHSGAGRVAGDGLVVGCRGDHGHRGLAVGYRMDF